MILNHHPINGLVERKIYRKPAFFPITMGCSCNFSLKPLNPGLPITKTTGEFSMQSGSEKDNMGKPIKCSDVNLCNYVYIYMVLNVQSSYMYSTYAYGIWYVYMHVLNIPHLPYGITQILIATSPTSQAMKLRGPSIAAFLQQAEVPGHGVQLP